MTRLETPSALRKTARASRMPAVRTGTVAPLPPGPLSMRWVGQRPFARQGRSS